MEENIRNYKLVRNLLIGIFGLIILSSVKIQVIEGRKYYRLSEENRIQKRYIPAPRGKIYDRRRKELANTRPGFYVSVMQTLVNDTTLEKIAQILNTDVQSIKDKMKMEKNRFKTVKIAHDISSAQLSLIEENSDRLEGTEVGVEPVRNYPYGEILCHLLGYVGEITYDEVKNNETYSIGDYIGRMGLEQFYEKRLRGTDGVEYVEVDVRGRDLGTLSEKRPIPIIPGHDLITTIDLALSESVSVYLKDYKKAACVCLDPRNGEVLVLYSKPGFDPNLFSHGLGSEDWIRLNNDPDAPMYNRAIMSCYPPGSTFKPFVALAALDAAMVDENRRFEPCRGEYRLGTRIFKCWKKHGSLNLIDGVIHSCDIYFYQLGRLIGIDTLYERANRVGLGKITGIDLPNEKAGLLPDRRWFENRYGKNWTEGHILNLSIGQGDLLVTPLQLACAFTTFANNGMIVIPRLLKDTKPDYRRSGLSEEAIAKIKKSLAGVVSAGTGTLARIRQCTVCGKTGTAQNPHGDDHALFVGFAPADDPKILVCIIVENAGHGGSVAAPIAGRIMNLYLESTDNQISGEPVIQVTCSKKPIQH